MTLSQRINSSNKRHSSAVTPIKRVVFSRFLNIVFIAIGGKQKKKNKIDGGSETKTSEITENYNKVYVLTLLLNREKK